MAIPNAVSYEKHLVECTCVLPQFKHSDPQVWHSFVVFSEVDARGGIIPSFAQCNNCGMVHKVLEVGVSSVLKRDDLPSILTIGDVKNGLPERLRVLLEGEALTLPTYQEIAFILEHAQWGKSVLLAKDRVDGFLVGKKLQIFGETLWKVQKFQEEEEEEEESDNEVLK